MFLLRTAIPDTDLFGNPVAELVKPQIDTGVCDLLTEKGISYTDKRYNGGALWVIGDHSLDSIMLELAEKGYKFLYSEKGGKQTKGKPGWYLRAPKS